MKYVHRSLRLPLNLNGVGGGLDLLSQTARRLTLQIWRPFTGFFYGGGGFPLLYDFFLIYRNSSALERNV